MWKGLRKRIAAFFPTGKSGKTLFGRMPAHRIALDLITGILLSAAIAYLFYRSVWAVGSALIIVPLYLHSRKEKWIETRRRNLQRQFISAMQMVSGSLMAGYSMENAWRAAEKELSILYGPEAEFCEQMRQMNQRMAVNEPLEKILEEFSDSCGVEDICRFGEVFGYAKKSGGNLCEIIRSVTVRMQEKEEILAEIETAVAAKKMEQRMMNFLLPGILFFITISSPSYVSSLYHNPLGILVMSVCLGGYLGCVFWSEKLTNIAV